MGVNLSAQFRLDAQYLRAFQGLTNPQAEVAQNMLSQFFGLNDSFSMGAGGQFGGMPGLLLPPPQAGGVVNAQMAQSRLFGNMMQMNGSSYSMASSLPMFQQQMFQSGQLSQQAGLNMQMQMQMQISGQIQINGLGQGVQEQTEDPYAVARCRGDKNTGSNLNNSPHLKLALYNILKDKSYLKPDALAKELKDRYGIMAEAKDFEVNGKKVKGLQFQNGSKFVDGNGNGGLDMSDYKLKEAVKDIEKQYGITAEQFDKVAKQAKTQTQGLGFGNQQFGNQYGNQFQQNQFMPQMYGYGQMMAQHMSGMSSMQNQYMQQQYMQQYMQAMQAMQVSGVGSQYPMNFFASAFASAYVFAT